jgi:Ca2+:H+ antiporter
LNTAKNGESISPSKTDDEEKSLVVNPLNVNGITNQSGSIDVSQSNSAGSKGEDDDEEEEDILGFNYACLWLAVITVFIAILSDAISATIEDAGESYKISGVFLSTIVLPIIGNAAEHASAVIFGMRDKLDLSLGIAIGSSCQIAVFVIPLMVVVGWIADKDMSLNFGFFESMTMFLTVICVTFAIKDGTSNFFLGFILIIAYIIIAAGFLSRYDEPLDSTN